MLVLDARGLGVELRELALQGVMDSTAADRYDFSGFGTGLEVISSARRSSRPAAPLFPLRADEVPAIGRGRCWGSLERSRRSMLANLTAKAGDRVGLGTLGESERHRPRCI